MCKIKMENLMKRISLLLFLALSGLLTIVDISAWHRRSYCGWYNRGCGNMRSCDYSRCGGNNCYGNYNGCYANSCGYANRYNGCNNGGCNASMVYNGMGSGSCGTGCGYQSACGTTISRVIENPPCGPAPCCLKTVQVPANLIQKVDYYWECPQNCNISCGQSSCGSVQQETYVMPQDTYYTMPQNSYSVQQDVYTMPMNTNAMQHVTSSVPMNTNAIQQDGYSIPQNTVQQSVAGAPMNNNAAPQNSYTTQPEY